jgi:hypothetical protein
MPLAQVNSFFRSMFGSEGQAVRGRASIFDKCDETNRIVLRAAKGQRPTQIRFHDFDEIGILFKPQPENADFNLCVLFVLPSESVSAWDAPR